MAKVAQAAQAYSNRLHVIAREGSWVVKRDKAKRVLGIYDTETQAIDAATAQVKSGKADYALVHDLYGRIAQKII